MVVRPLTLLFLVISVGEEKKLEDAALTASTKLKEALQKERREKSELQKNVTALQVMSYVNLVNIIEIQSRNVIKKFTTEKLSLGFSLSGKI